MSVMFSKTVEEYIGTLLGLTERKQKNEILTFLGIGMGGVLVALQALMSYKTRQCDGRHSSEHRKGAATGTP